MNGIANFLTFLNDNWTLLLTIGGAVAGIVIKTRSWFAKSKDEKIAAAIEALRVSMLSLVTEAEKEYGGGTGSVKRSQVLQKIFEQYPVLAQAVKIDDTTKLLDSMIDDALVEMRELLENNEAFYDLIHNTLTLTEAELAELNFTGVLVPGQEEATVDE